MSFDDVSSAGTMMDFTAASTILDVPKDASIEDVKRVYRARAQLLHPDRAEDRLKPHAQRAMAQLNEAYAAFQQRCGYEPPKSPPPPPPPRAERETPDAAGPEQHLPGINECDLCGSSPARPMRLQSITGLVVKWNTKPLTHKVCRPCGIALYNDTQASILIRGWWSWAGLVVSVAALVQNRVALSGHRKAVSPITKRDPLVIAPRPRPLQSVPVWNRRGPWFATVAYLSVAVTVVAVVLAGVSWGKQAITLHPEPVTFPLEECLDVNGGVAPCDSPAAAYQLTMGVLHPTHCGSLGDAWRFTGDDTWYCAKRL